jgi:hypothetical protein
MKKLLKFFIYFVLAIITLIIVLLVIAKLSENKITDIALKKVSESIEAPVVIGDVSFNLIRAFPLATIELKDVMLSSPNRQIDSDSLSLDLNSIVNISRIYVSVKSKPLLKGEIEIMKIDIDGANVNYSVDSSGTTNIDFLIASSDTTTIDTVPSDPLNITLTDFSAKNITCNYIDSSLKVQAKVFIPELRVKAKLKGEDVIASANGAVHISNASFEGTNLHLMEKTEVNFDVAYQNDSVDIKQLDIKTDGANLAILGGASLGDEIKTDLVVSGNNMILNELLKYAPKEILDEFGLNALEGELNLKAQVQGIYSESEMPKVDLTIDFKNGRIAMREYPAIRNIEFNGDLTNGVLRNNKSTQARFETFHFETNQSKFDIAFSVLDIDHPRYNIKTVVDINIAEFKDFIPDSLIPYIDGNIKANLSTKGVVPDSIGDDFIDFAMANTYANIELIDFDVDLDSSLFIRDFSSKLSYKPNNFKVDDLYISIPAYNANLKNSSFDAQFSGSINNTSDLGIDLKSYHIETEQSKFSGSAKIKNLDHPTYNFISNIKLSLDEVKTMLPDSLLNVLKGDVLANIESKGTIDLDSIENDAMDIVFNSSSFDIQLSNISVEMPDDTLYKIENLSGNIKMNPEAISIHKMKGVAAGLSFEIDSTEIWNTYKVLIQELENELITVQTNIVLGDITNSFITAFMGSETEPQDQIADNSSKSEEDNLQTKSESTESKDSIETTPEPLLPNFQELGVPHFLVRGKLAINKLEYEKNIIDDISLKFRFADSLYVIDEFKLKTCGGEINTSLLLNARGRFWEKPVIDIRTKIDKLNINELLILNDNFGDTSITYEKFAGLLTSKFDARVTYIEGTFPTEKIRAEGHFTLENGKIYGYEPLMELSKNKVLGGLKELDMLDFNTLNTSLFMYKDKIYIPKTDVVTSSMDFTAFAMHSMSDDYEYHLKIHLGDVFTGKSERLMKEQAKQNKMDRSAIERNGLEFISSKEGKKIKTGFDNDKLKKEFKKDLNKQQGWLRLLFNPLLVNFSTDLDRTIRNKEIIEKYGKKNE